MPMLMVAFLLVFIVLFGGFASLLYRFWLRPKGAVARITGATAGPRPVVQEKDARHPSLVFRDMLNRLGEVVPMSPKDVTTMQRRLIRAGFRSGTSLRLLYGSKVVLAVLLPV